MKYIKTTILVIIGIVSLSAYFIFNKTNQAISGSIVAQNRTGITLNLNMGNSDGSTIVYDTSGNQHDFTAVGSITLVEGTDGYIENNNTSGRYITNTDGDIFASLTKTVVIKFRPEFAPDANDNYVLYDSLAPRHSVNKLNNANSNVIRIYFGGVVVKNIPQSDYEDSWKVGEDNILTITVEGTADTMNVWLNGNQVVTNSNTAFTPVGEGQIYSGGSPGQGWDGRIYYIKVWSRILTDEEIVIINSNKTHFISTSTITYIITSSINYKR